VRRLLPLLLAACSSQVGAPRYGETGDRAEVLAALEGFSDPVAAWLRGALTEDGTIRGDYRDVLDGAGVELGCDAESEKSFVVLSNLDYVPKTIFTRCSNDAAAASRFFLALPATSDAGDVADDVVHVSAWDAAVGVYRFYSLARTSRAGAGEMAVEVEPRFCLDCHGGPHEVGRWQPFMNEMTNPWSHWNARPGFASQLFDEHLDRAMPERPRYREVTARLASAADLEPIVRAGLERFVGARLAARTAPASDTAALELIRPLFCDETVNYVSEIHDTGELRASAVVDDALRLLLRQARPGRWDWLDEPTLTLPRGERPLTLIPVRGASVVEAELGLVARGVLSVEEALRIRALDWERPVFSDARCDLWRGLHGRPLGGATVEEAARAALDEVLAKLPELGSIEALGEAIAARRSAITRAGLGEERARRVCRAVAEYPTAPLYEDVDC
jgi:hypothetical protein